MIIELQEPFKSIWQKGYLQVHANEGNRKYVCLYNSNNNRTLISYARYLMCVKVGYVLPPELEVDHIDDDKTNDAINNLQILTSEQNRYKQHLLILEQQELYYFECPICDRNFLRDKRQAWKFFNTGKIPTCSKECGYKQTSQTLTNK